MATGITVLIVMITKFIAGAWITALLIPFLLIFMFAVRRHYARAAHVIASNRPVDLNNLQAPLVIVPLQTWNRISERAIRFAFSLSHDIRVIHIIGEGTGGDAPNPFHDAWERNVVEPARAAGLPEPRLEFISSPYRLVIGPIRDYILQVANQHRDRQITVVIPELVTVRWYQILLHNHLATGLKTILLVEGNERISVVNVPWYLRA